MEAKKELRKKFMTELAGLSLPTYEHMSYMIAKNLYEDADWKKARTIGITISKKPEVDTFQIIRTAWEQGKRIVVPKCEPQSRGLDFRVLTSFNQLESVFYGLYEPMVAETETMEAADIDLIVVPGIAFNRAGYRLGFGGGYYDRFLAAYQGKTLSLAFHNQLVPDLPIEDHDIPVGKIITDQEVIIIGN